MNLKIEASSFRDNKGHVYLQGDKVYRTVMPCAVDDFDKVRHNGFIHSLIDNDLLLQEQQVSKECLGELSNNASYLLQHPKLSFISYPYEWPFSALKAAALLHLDIHLRALEQDVHLSDSSAFNIQFLGITPIFIDHLSFRPYKAGEFWLAHRQFCQQFLNPLLLTAWAGLPYQPWYRGNMQGISTVDIAKCLPWYRKLSWRSFTQVVLQGKLQQSSRQKALSKLKPRQLPKAVLCKMLKDLKHWIECLEFPNSKASQWQDYERENNYSVCQEQEKQKFVEQFVKFCNPTMLWDFGCNSGRYAEIALVAGAKKVIGFDADLTVLEQAYERAKQKALDFQPLYLDFSDPSPAQGWAGQERKSLLARGPADALLALALVHHVVLVQNIPLTYFLDWLLQLAPCGVIEFVPKTDPMVQLMLQLREDIFVDYSEENFINSIQQKAKIIKKQRLSGSERLLVWYAVDAMEIPS